MNIKRCLFIIHFILLIWSTFIDGSISRKKEEEKKNDVKNFVAIGFDRIRGRFDMIRALIDRNKKVKEKQKEKNTVIEDSLVSGDEIALKEDMSSIDIPEIRKETENSEVTPEKIKEAAHPEIIPETRKESALQEETPEIIKKPEKMISYPLNIDAMQLMGDFMTTRFVPFAVGLLMIVMLVLSKIYWSKTNPFKTLSKQAQRDSVYQALSSMEAPFNIPSLFTSLDSALLILRIARSVDPRLSTPEIDNFYEYLNEVERNGSLIRQGFGGLKVLCIEGLACSGKSTLIEGLVESTGAIRIESLKGISVEIQQQFKDVEVPEVVATALAFALNYCTAYQIITETSQTETEKIVIMEQFHHSLCASTVSSHIPMDTDLGTFPSSVFEWPVNLPRPTLVIFLQIGSDERLQRMQTNKKSEDLVDGNDYDDNAHNRIRKTMEKKDLGHDDRTTEVYSLITGPPTIALDASLSPLEVLTSALEACEEFDIYTPPVTPKKKGNARISMGFYDGLARF